MEKEERLELEAGKLPSKGSQAKVRTAAPLRDVRREKGGEKKGILLHKPRGTQGSGGADGKGPRHLFLKKLHLKVLASLLTAFRGKTNLTSSDYPITTVRGSGDRRRPRSQVQIPPNMVLDGTKKDGVFRIPSGDSSPSQVKKQTSNRERERTIIQNSREAEECGRRSY